MKKRIVLVMSLIFVTAFLAFAQMNNPVSWRFKSEKLGTGEFLLTFYADIESGWYLYSQNIEDGGPIPTTFKFTPLDTYKLVGKVVESEKNREVIKDEIFDMELIKFHGQAVFKQKVKVSDTSKPITGTVQFMSCSGDRCTPPIEEKFSFNL